MKRTIKRASKNRIADSLEAVRETAVVEALPLNDFPPQRLVEADKVASTVRWDDIPGPEFIAAVDVPEELLALEEPAAAIEDDDTSSPDDALGLYLRQMGAIPLLNRKQELALAERLATQRHRFRHAAMCNWRTLSLIVETFERVKAGQLCSTQPLMS